MRRTRELLLDGVRCVCRELRVWGGVGLREGCRGRLASCGGTAHTVSC